MMTKRNGVTRLVRGGLLTAVGAILALGASGSLGAQGTSTAGPDGATIREADTRQWLTYLSSDLLQGRQVFTEGYGLASSYIAEQLRLIGVEPLGQDGTYFQPLTRRGFRITQDSSVTVAARGESRTFRHGDHVSFSNLAGAAQTLTFKGVEFAGYGLGMVPGAEDAPAGSLDGRLVLFVSGVPKALVSKGGQLPRNLSGTAGRASAIVRGPTAAAAAIGFSPLAITPRPSAPGGGEAPPATGRQTPRADLLTVLPVDRVVPPAMTADEEFFTFVFGEDFKAVRSRAQAGEPLSAMRLVDVDVTINVNVRYDVISTERTQNVVGIVRGSDPGLRDSYVLFGAHLDHVGYAIGAQPRGRANVPVEQDAVWNGADDDGSGSAAVLGIAKAFVTGPKPRRSAVFVWHAGEEEGLLGSQYMAEHPVVPLDRVQAVFNIDMIGRNRDDKPEQADTVYVIGADRISTDLHNLIEESNRRVPRPLTLDYEYNDVTDPNSFYTRSDHYSYASKGVPSAFFFTGTHVDYHANTDTVDKILFPKLVRIADFIYRAGFAVADRAQDLERDNLGSRSGRGFSGVLPRQTRGPLPQSTP
jgi:hypothetical protein